MRPETRERGRNGDGGRSAFLSSYAVSRETLQALDAYAALLRQWQARTNLVAASTLDELWTRHIGDSVQFLDIAPSARQWADLGSGGGFPGLVTAILLKDRGQGHVALVESNAKKAAFLRAVIRETGISATVHALRIEAAPDVLAAADAVSARALASLDGLLGLVSGRIGPDVPCYFAKGRHYEQEILDAETHWRFTMVRHWSRSDPQSVILEVRRIERRDGGSE